MKHWIILALFTAVLAGCGGGSSTSTSTSNRVEELETELEQARKKAEAAELAADAERQARLAAEQQRDSAQGEVAGAEEEARQAGQERDEAQQELDRFVALEIVNARFPPSSTGPIPSVPQSSHLSYRQPVLAAATGATFTSTRTGSSERVVHDDSIRKHRAEKRLRRNLLQRGNSNTRGHSRLFCPR